MQVPNSWRDITIGRFIAAYDVLTAEHESELDKEVAFCAAITGVTEDIIYALPIDEFKEISKQLSFVSNLETIGTKFPKWFCIGGMIYRPVRDLRKLTGGQYIDLMTFVKGDDKRLIHNLHLIMATVCRPLFRRKYKGETHAKTAAIFKEQMSVAIAYPVALFFCAVWLNSMPAILDCSGETETAKMIRKMLKQTPSSMN